MKRVICLFVALCIIASVLTVAVSAAPKGSDGYLFTQSENTQETNFEQYPLDYIYDTPDAIRSEQEKAQKKLQASRFLLSASPLQKAYSSVGDGLVTGMRNQGTYGLCWAFAATAAAESSLIKSGERDKLIDLSELQLVYNMYGQPSCDPLGNADGDMIVPTDGNWKMGGNSFWAMWAMSAWANGTEEVNMPYSMITEDIPEGYNNQNAAAYLQNARIIFYEAAFDTTTGLVALVGKNNDIKQAIIDKGAVAMAYDHAFTWYNSSEDLENNVNGIEGYSTVYKSHFLNSPYYSGGGHGITVVGWNDDFPKEYFTTTAPGNGAWLCKNSWGDTWGTDSDTDFEDYADAQSEGYYWISYYDLGLAQDGAAFVFDFDNAGKYDNNYHYDGGCANASLTLEEQYSVGANYEVKSSAEEKIKAASIGFFSSDVDYSLQIYKVDDINDDPFECGIKLLDREITGTTDYPGYYTVEIPEELQPTLKKGDVFSVVFTLSGEGAVATACDTTVDFGAIQTYANTENDITFLHIGDYTEWPGEFGFTVRVKAFTSNVGENNGIMLNTSSVELFCDISDMKTAQLYPIVENNDGYTYSWSSSNKGVAKVDKNGLVKAVSQGSAVITLTARKSGEKTVTASCKVTVNKTTKHLKTDRKYITATTGGEYTFIQLKTTEKSKTNIYVDGGEYIHGGKAWENVDPGYTDAYLINGIILRYKGSSVRVEVWKPELCTGKTTEVRFVDKYTGESAICYITVKTSISSMQCDSETVLCGNFVQNIDLVLSGDCSNYDIVAKTSSCNIKLTKGKPIYDTENNTVTIPYQVKAKQSLLFDPEAKIVFTDKVSGYSAECTVYICANSGIKMSETMLTLSVKDTALLKTSVKGLGKCLVLWTSSDRSVATVENGKIKAISSGKAVITAYYLTGYATCVVNVTE